MTESNRTAWLFPGQGSQTVGMGKALCEADSKANAILEHAADVADLPLKEYAWQGPPTTLARTDVLQPALTAVMLGAAHALRKRGARPDVVAGHSLGEFAALHAAGVLDLDDTLRLVAERGRLMHAATEKTEGSMIAVLKLDDDVVRETVAGLPDDAGVVDVANYNAPGQIVVSGTPEGLETAAEALAAKGASIRFLDVSGAWHSQLMTPANDDFADALDAATFHAPDVPVVQNVTAQPEDDPERIRENLAAQLTHPVRWVESMEWVIDDGVTRFVEVGPGKVLRGLMRYIWKDFTAYEVVSVNTPRHVESFEVREAPSGARDPISSAADTHAAKTPPVPAD